MQRTKQKSINEVNWNVITMLIAVGTTNAVQMDAVKFAYHLNHMRRSEEKRDVEKFRGKMFAILGFFPHNLCIKWNGANLCSAKLQISSKPTILVQTAISYLL